MSYQIIALKEAAKRGEPAAGMRLARIIAKAVEIEKGQPKAAQIDGRKIESQAVLVPAVSLGMIQSILADEVGKEWMKQQVAAVQDGLIRRAIAVGKNSIFDDQIEVGALLAAMQQQEAAVRFSKESIAIWFDSDLRMLLAAAISEKLPGISSDKLDRLIAGYRSDFQSLAAREVFMAPQTKAKLTKALALLPDDYESIYSAIAEKVFEKFAAAGTSHDVGDAL